MCADSLRVLRLCSVFAPPEGEVPAEAVRFDPVGGMQTHTGELTRALDAMGVTQFVVTTRPPGSVRLRRFESRAAVVRLGAAVPMCRQFYSVPASFVLPRLAGRVDVVHAHLGEDIAVVPLALAALRGRGVPLVLTMHTSVRHTLAVTGARSALLKTLGGYWESVGQRRAAAVIALTPRLRDRLVSGGVAPERIHVIPSGVGPSLLSGPVGEPDRPDRPRILFVGRLHPQKGVDTAVRAMTRLPDAELVLAGEGPERARLAALAARLGVAERVRFLGFVAHSRIAGLLRDAHVLVMPSRYEELGTALVEAMHTGTPVVASRVGGIPDLVTHGVHGMLVTPGDADELAGALGRVLSSPALAGTLAANARQRAADYRWDALAGRVLEVYRQAVSRDGDGAPTRRGRP
jgi:glycosyltransferase involved in cell wall biosynthesis